MVGAAALLQTMTSCRRKNSTAEFSSTAQSENKNNSDDFRAEERPQPERRVSLEEVKAFVEQRLRMRSASPTKLFSFEPLCLDTSALWLKELQSSSLNGYLQQTQGLHFFTIDGKKVMRSPTHFFIAFNPRTEDEIVLDATYAQFIVDAQGLGLNPILVQKTSEIKHTFSRYRSRIRTETEGDNYIGRYDPKEAAELIYSTGIFKKNRTSFE
jgi:hypothetical protein